MKMPKGFKMDSEGPRHVHECEDCKTYMPHDVLDAILTFFEHGTPVSPDALYDDEMTMKEAVRKALDKAERP